MLKRIKLSVLAAALLAAGSTGIATAQRGIEGRSRPQAQPRDDGSWRSLGEVGTHRHDAEDYVKVSLGTPIESIQLRASDGPVALDGVIVQYTDGSKERVSVNRQLRAGETVTVALPRGRGVVKMLVLDYANSGPHWRARETAHVEVFAQVGHTRGPRDDRFRGRFDQPRGGRYGAPRGDQATAGDRTVRPRTQTPTRTQPPTTTPTRDRDGRPPEPPRDKMPIVWPDWPDR